MTANPFYKGNSDASIGAPARVLIAASTFPFPVDLDNIFDRSGGTYNPTFTTYGWVDAGYTSAETSLSHSVDIQRWRNEQTGEYRSVPVDYHGTVGSEFIQITAANKENLMLAVAAANTPNGQIRHDFTVLDSLPKIHLAVSYIDHLKKFHASVFPKAMWNGAAITQAIARGQAIRIPMTWDIYAEDTLTGADGNRIFRYDLDEP